MIESLLSDFSFAGRELDPFMGVARPRARFMNLFTFQRKNETEKPDGKSIQETDGFLKTNQWLNLQLLAFCPSFSLATWRMKGNTRYRSPGEELVDANEEDSKGHKEINL